MFLNFPIIILHYANFSHRAFARMGNAYVKKDDLYNGLKYYEKSLSEHRVQDVVKKTAEVGIINAFISSK